MATNRGFYQAKPPATSGSNTWVSSLRSGPTSQIFGEPPCGRVRSTLELIGISGEMSHGKELQPFWFSGAVECIERKICGAYHIRVPDHHQQRRRSDSFYEGARFVLRIELQGSKSYLVTPFRKAPLVFRRR